SNLKSSTPEEAQRVSSFAGAAYCSTHTLTSWKCNHCERIGAGIQVKHIFEDLFTGGRGFLALDEAKKQIIVSFRGSYNIQNWVGNARLLQSQYLVESGGTDIYIHTGFKDGINALLPKFKNEFDTLLKEHGDFKVIVTGHSLGGAMATLASIELKKAFGLNWDRIELFTYGEPRVGNLAFAEWFNSQTLTVSRVVNDRDIV
ncbi:alpha/beta-hydrolase, partial [Neoconidiobolus thromboides FSU 785]